MPKIYHVANPYAPLDELEASTVSPGTTIMEYLVRKYPGFLEFSEPTICVVNGAGWLRADWVTTQLKDGDMVVFMPAVGGTAVIYAVIAIVIAVAVVVFMDFAIPANEGLPSSDPVYSLSGQQNQNKKGEPIEKHYGHVRHWPSLASRPYNQFHGDDEYLYLLLCVGIGKYYVDEILNDDTPIGELNDVEYEVLPPGKKVTLFPTFVETSTEVGGIDLTAPNEPDYDWSGWFVLTSVGAKTHHIELDISFRQGLYKSSKGGGTDPATVELEFEYQRINDAGTAVGSEGSLWTPEIELNTTQQRRFTKRFEVPKPGRYQVRGRRITDHMDDDDDGLVRDVVTWERARAFNKTHQNFGNVTLLAIKARATKQLNNQSQNRWNVRLRTKTKVWTGDTWELQDTRSPIWAAVDILRAKYGRGLTNKHINLITMGEIASDVEEDGINFDWTFDQRDTVWPAINVCLNVCRARPVIPNAQVSVVRDVAMTEATIGFNSHNIRPGSFKVSMKLPVVGDHDGLEVEYINDTSWERETVLCLLDTDKGTNPKRIRLSGCTDRDMAYRWGLATRAMEIDQIVNIELSTGIEGGTAVFGDLVAVQHDLLPVPHDNPQDQTGRLAHGAITTGGGNTDVVLPVIPVFTAPFVHRISIRDRTGLVQGPYTCVAHPSDPYAVRIAITLDTELLEVPADAEAALYWFGRSGREMMLCKATKIAPAEGDNITLTLVPYTERVYSFGAATAPPLDAAPSVVTAPKKPVVEGLAVHYLPDSISEALVTWAPAQGAGYYRVEKSNDGGVTYTFVDNTQVASYRMIVRDEHMYLRVAGIGSVGIGPWALWDGTVGGQIRVPRKIKGLRLERPFKSDVLYVLWDSEFLADEYNVQIYLDTDLLTEFTVEDPRASYDAVQAKADAVTAVLDLDRTLKVKVAGVNSIGTGVYSSILTVTNPKPATLTGMSSDVLNTVGSRTFVLLEWDQAPDSAYVESYWLWIKYGTSGVGTGSYDVRKKMAGNSYQVRVDAADYGTMYWKVAAKDRWGEDMNLCAEQSVTVP